MNVSVWWNFRVQALAGEVGMSNELDNVARSLYNGHIPGIWRRLAPATLKTLGDWMIHFQQRYEQYELWVLRSFYAFTLSITPSFGLNDFCLLNDLIQYNYYVTFNSWSIFLPRDAAQSAVLHGRSSVGPSVTLRYCGHNGWNTAVLWT